MRPWEVLLLGIDADVEQPADLAGIPVGHRLDQGAPGRLDSGLGQLPEPALLRRVTGDEHPGGNQQRAYSMKVLRHGRNLSCAGMMGILFREKQVRRPAAGPH